LPPVRLHGYRRADGYGGLRDIPFSCQPTCTAIIERARGKAARIFGDGILAVFGYPARATTARSP